MSVTDLTPGAAPATPDALVVPAPSADVAAWQAWRTERDESLATEHGWLSLTALHNLPTMPQALPGLPGQWWADADGAHVRAAASDGIHLLDDDGQVTETVLDGLDTVAVPAGTSTLAVIAPQNRAVEIALRSGRYLARVRDPQAPARTSFTGVPTYDYDPAWVIEAPVRWYPEPVAAVVGAAQPELHHDVLVLGELDLTHDGRTVTLKITGATPAAAAVLFSDDNAATAGWRTVYLDGLAAVGADEGAPATVRLDLNRALNLPSAFSAFGTCPRPVDGNHVPFAVTAGEQAPGAATSRTATSGTGVQR